MTKQLLILALAATLGACSRNPDPEYAADSDDDGAEAAAQQSTAATASAVPASVTAARLSEAEAMRLGRAIVAALAASDIETIWTRFDANMKEGLESQEAFAQSVARMFERLGAEGNVVSEEIMMPEDRPGVTMYVRRSHYLAAGRDAILRIAFHPDGTIGGMGIGPAE